jgi:hypothetical protein
MLDRWDMVAAMRAELHAAMNVSKSKQRMHIADFHPLRNRGSDNSSLIRKDNIDGILSRVAPGPAIVMKPGSYKVVTQDAG